MRAAKRACQPESEVGGSVYRPDRRALPDQHRRAPSAAHARLRHLRVSTGIAGFMHWLIVNTEMAVLRPGRSPAERAGGGGRCMAGRPGTTTAIDARGVATIAIENPAKLNTLNRDIMRALIADAEALARRPALRGVVLRGAGTRAFIGGADITEMAALNTTDARDFITLVHQSCDVIRRLPVPVIARIQGYVLGAGLEVAAACDMRIAATDARFGMPEVRVASPPLSRPHCSPA